MGIVCPPCLRRPVPIRRSSQAGSRPTRNSSLPAASLLGPPVGTATSTALPSPMAPARPPPQTSRIRKQSRDTCPCETSLNPPSSPGWTAGAAPKHRPGAPTPPPLPRTFLRRVPAPDLRDRIIPPSPGRNSRSGRWRCGTRSLSPPRRGGATPCATSPATPRFGRDRPACLPFARQSHRKAVSPAGDPNCAGCPPESASPRATPASTAGHPSKSSRGSPPDPAPPVPARRGTPET